MEIKIKRMNEGVHLPWQMPAWVDSQGGDGRREEAVWTPDKHFVTCIQTTSMQFGVLVADKQHQGIITSDSKIILRLLFEDDFTQASIQESKD